METNQNLVPEVSKVHKRKPETSSVQEALDLTPTKPLLSEKEHGAIRMQQERERKSKMVKGVFKNHETPGSCLKFPYREFKGDPVKKYKFEDGQVYEVPLGVAEHLNERCSYPIHAHALDEYGRPSSKIGQQVKRFGFYPIGFSGEFGKSPSSLVTVEQYPNITRVGY